MGANVDIPYGDGRGEILNATVALIAENGLDGFALRQVSTRAAMVVGSVTHHFRDRATLISSALTAHVERVEAMADNALTHGESTLWDSAEQAIFDYFGNWQSALIGAELRLAATRDPATRALNDRVLDSENRLIDAYDPTHRAGLLAEVHACALESAALVADSSQYFAEFACRARELLRSVPRGSHSADDR